jgi:hypothetical protein
MLFHFRERQRAHLAFPGVPLLFAVMEATVALTMSAPLLLHIVQWTIVGLMVVVAVLVRELSIRVNAEHLIFGFGLFRRKVRLADITEVKIVDTTALKTGIGVRTLAEGLMAWIAAAGSAIEVKTSDGRSGKPFGYVISTARPSDLAAALKSGSSSRTLEAP